MNEDETMSTLQPSVKCICPVHGRLGGETLKFSSNSWESPTFCMKCLGELLEKELPVLEQRAVDA